MGQLFVRTNGSDDGLFASKRIVVVYEPEIILAGIYHRHLHQHGIDVIVFGKHDDLHRYFLEGNQAHGVLYSIWNCSDHEQMTRLREILIDVPIVSIMDSEEYEDILSSHSHKILNRRTSRPVEIISVVKEYVQSI